MCDHSDLKSQQFGRLVRSGLAKDSELTEIGLKAFYVDPDRIILKNSGQHLTEI